jgi:hypothetical protein
MDAVDLSVEQVNAAIGLLAREAADAASFARVSKVQLQLRQALQTFSQLVNLWRAAATHVAALEYGSAAELIGGMEHMTEAFYRITEEVRCGEGGEGAAGGERGGRRRAAHAQRQKARPSRHSPPRPSPPSVPRAQIADHLHPQRCADSAPMAPFLWHSLMWGSAAAVALALLVTCGPQRKKSKKG